jgi:hypothetical protein
LEWQAKAAPWPPSQSACTDELRGARKTRDDGLSGLPSQSACSPVAAQAKAAPWPPSQSACTDELRGARKTRDDGLSGLPSQSACSTACLRCSPVAAQAKAAPWPPSQPERPGTDFSYKAASARGLKFVLYYSSSRPVAKPFSRI